MEEPPIPNRCPPLLPLLLVAVLGCAPQPSTGAPTVTVQPLFPSQPPPARIGELEVLGAYVLRSGDRDFGGISSARRKGGTLYLLSDRSTLFEVAWPEAGSAGLGARLPIRTKRRLTTFHGDPLDAEALVVTEDGSFLVGDESDGRVLRFARADGTREGKPVRLPRAFVEGGALNRGLETLAAVPPGGSLVAILEGAVSDDALHPAVLVDEDGGQEPFVYRAGDGFQVTDADVAGEWLLVLERRLSLFGGWHGRIVAVPLADLDQARRAPVAGRELAIVTGPAIGENYEGLAARAEPDGSLVMLLVSDDNFNALQSTQLLELRWRP